MTVINHHYIPIFLQKGYSPKSYSPQTNFLFRKKKIRENLPNSSYCLDHLFTVSIPGEKPDIIETNIWNLDTVFAIGFQTIVNSHNEMGLLNNELSNNIFSFILSLKLKHHWLKGLINPEIERLLQNYLLLSNKFNLNKKNEVYIKNSLYSNNSQAHALLDVFFAIEKRHQLPWKNFIYHVRTDHDLLFGEDMLVSVNKHYEMVQTTQVGLSSGLLFLPLSRRDLIICSQVQIPNLDDFKKPSFCRSLNYIIADNSKWNFSGSYDEVNYFIQSHISEIKKDPKNSYHDLCIKANFNYHVKKESKKHQSLLRKTLTVRSSFYLQNDIKRKNLLGQKISPIFKLLDQTIYYKNRYWFKHYYSKEPSVLKNQLLKIATETKIGNLELQSILKNPYSIKSLRYIFKTDLMFNISLPSNFYYLKNNLSQEFNLKFIQDKKFNIPQFHIKKTKNSNKIDGVICEVTNYPKFNKKVIEYVFIAEKEGSVFFYSITPKGFNKKMVFSKKFNGELIKIITD